MVEEISARSLGALTEVGVGGKHSGCRTDRCPLHILHIYLGEGNRIPSAVTLIIQCSGSLNQLCDV